MQTVATLSYSVEPPPYGLIAFDQLEYVWSRTAGLPIVNGFWIAGQNVDPNRDYQVALHEGSFLALQRFNSTLHLNLNLSRLETTGVEAWRAIVSYAADEGHLTIPKLRDDARVRTLEPDPAIALQSIRYQAGYLHFDVTNEGLETARDAWVQCWSGLPDDPVALSTELQIFNSIGVVSIPEINPDQKIGLALPWSPHFPALWPIRCQLNALPNMNSYIGNDTATRVIRAGNP